MDKRLERILPRVQKPARYTGGEYNQILKDRDAVDRADSSPGSETGPLHGRGIQSDPEGQGRGRSASRLLFSGHL